MSLDTLKLREFVARANTAPIEPLPLVHSTPSRNVYDVFKTGKVVAMPCNVFKGENLCYCFVGRPSYKWQTQTEAKYWQLPLVFVIRFDTSLALKRVYPFDSGAFASAGRLPDYITAFGLDAYGVEPAASAVGRMVSLFYENNEEYFFGRAVDQDAFRQKYSLTPRHQEIEALLELYNDTSLRDADDRARTIEVQLEADLPLTRDNLIGVVLPIEYRKDSELLNTLSGAAQHTSFYHIYPNQSLSHTTQIYEEVRRILERSGHL